MGKKISKEMAELVKRGVITEQQLLAATQEILSQRKTHQMLDRTVEKYKFAYYAFAGEYSSEVDLIQTSSNIIQRKELLESLSDSAKQVIDLICETDDGGLSGKRGEILKRNVKNYIKKKWQWSEKKIDMVFGELTNYAMALEAL